MTACPVVPEPAKKSKNDASSASVAVTSCKHSLTQLDRLWSVEYAVAAKQLVSSSLFAFVSRA